MLHYKFALIVSAVLFSVTQASWLRRDDDDEPKPVHINYQVPDCGNIDAPCDLNCNFDVSCVPLGWNHTALPCACPAILCSNGYMYGYPDYRRAPALYGDTLAKQPHVVAPCYNCTPSAIAPYGKAQGNCADPDKPNSPSV
ncbi:uncharacterized protein FA14DRAFT_156662 [Meira miltonrushii]|uniref:Uncharacterized protein n=1 Tax=Meira miltonrushii TaxID=1280837 RepID=A0A316V8Q4_9BASI|nr:uncharacterized protein FA14DRAFT_156662 [Meira miltonrushii]PWN33987.1 hypothetical protein FA14DRAFT_156662 [Meira miltonrushii]